MDERILLVVGSVVFGWILREQFVVEPKEPKCNCGCQCGCHCEGGILFPLLLTLVATSLLGAAGFWLFKSKAERIEDSSNWGKGKKGVFGSAGKVLTLTG